MEISSQRHATFKQRKNTMNQNITAQQLIQLLSNLSQQPQVEDEPAVKHTFSYQDLKAVDHSPLAYHVHKREEEDMTDTEKRNATISAVTKLALIDPFSFVDAVAIMPLFGDLRTKAAKEAKDVWLAANPDKFPVTQKEFDKIKNISSINKYLPKAAKLDTYVKESKTTIIKGVQVKVPDYLMSDNNIVNVSLWSDYSLRAVDIEEALNKYGVYYKTAVQVFSQNKKGTKVEDAFLLIINKSNESESTLIQLNKDKLNETIGVLDELCEKLVDVIKTNDKTLSSPKIINLNH